MDCILFRHGIAVDREDWDGKEAQRPLTEKGRRWTREAAQGLWRRALIPTRILSSPLRRARETADILHRVFKTRSPVDSCQALVPDAPPAEILTVLRAFPADARIICVGHEPHLSAAAGVLMVGKPIPSLSLKKAGACLIHVTDPPRPGRGRLEWWVTAEQFRAMRAKSL